MRPETLSAYTKIKMKFTERKESKAVEHLDIVEIEDEFLLNELIVDENDYDVVIYEEDITLVDTVNKEVIFEQMFNFNVPYDVSVQEEEEIEVDGAEWNIEDYII